MAEETKLEAEAKKHPDALADDVRRLLREYGFALTRLTFSGKRGGTHDYG